jgi:hypothetical protein
MPVLEVTHVKEYHPRPAEPKSPVTIAKSAVAHLTSGGELDQDMAAKLEQRLATEMFPTLPLGKALTAWWATAAGAELQNAIVKRAHIATVCANPLGNGFESVTKDMRAMDDNQDGKHPDVDGDPDDELEKLGKEYAAKMGGRMSLAAAITEVLSTPMGKRLLERSLSKNLQRQYPISP